MFGAIFKIIPWGRVLVYGAIFAGVLSVLYYIKNAEENRARVETLRSQKEQLAQINAELGAEYQKQILVLQESLEIERQRDRAYEENIQTLQQGPDGECARNSPAISESLRLRRKRNTGR